MREYFPNKLWNYKNFNMVTELDIAGEFIYDGMHILNQMKSIDEVAQLFSFLYHISVGLERLQKIALVLIENVTEDNIDAFEERLKTHSHIHLSEQISKNSKTSFSTRENEFLSLVSTFYSSARYNRFNFSSQNSKEIVLVAEYIKKYLSPQKIQNHFFTNAILVSDDVKELFGRVIGSIARLYYEQIRQGCAQNNTYSYELRYNLKAEKVFLCQNRKNSLQDMKVTEAIVLKELLLFLRNTKANDSFLRFVNGITPLELDVGLLNEHLSDLSRGVISQQLTDEVEYLYEKNSYSKDRIELVGAIGNTNVLFDYKDIHDCIHILYNLLYENYNCIDFAEHFPEKLEQIDDVCTHEMLDDVTLLCSQLLHDEITQEEFIYRMMQYYTSITEFNNYS